MLITFKNSLFDSPNLDQMNCIPMSEFRRIRGNHDNAQIKNMIAGTEDTVLKEITVGENGLCDLNKFNDMVDLYVYLPNKDKQLSNQQTSPAMHYILSSNMKDKATSETTTLAKDELHLRRMLDFVWTRIQERFKNFSPAFRFFDLNFNNRVSFNEFILGMENLKVKLGSRDLLLIFNYLDKTSKGFIDYNDFCGLSEERRNNIDPAAMMLQEYKETGKIQYNFGKRQTRSPSRQNAHKLATEA